MNELEKSVAMSMLPPDKNDKSTHTHTHTANKNTRRKRGSLTMASPLNGTIYPRKKKVDGWIKSKDPRGFRESARFFLSPKSKRMSCLLQLQHKEKRDFRFISDYIFPPCSFKVLPNSVDIPHTQERYRE